VGNNQKNISGGFKDDSESLSAADISINNREHFTLLRRIFPEFSGAENY
jgi:hypothetical protein